MASPYYRYRYLVFLLFALATPLVIFGGSEARKGAKNRIRDWLPEQFEETQQLRWFISHFGSDELLMISWPGCTLDDPRLPHYAELLRSADPQSPGSPEWFERVMTGPAMLRRFTSEPINLSPEEARERMHGWLLGDDGETTCAIALISEAGFENRQAAVEFAYRCALPVEGLSPEMLHIAGPTIESVAINEASKSSVTRYTPLAGLLALVLTYLCLRSFRVTLMVLVTAAFSRHLSVALIYYTGEHMDSVAVMIPTLVYVLAISAGIHLANYYREAVYEGGLEGAVMRAVGFAWKPSALAALTTALGLISLRVSLLVPVQRFAIYGALGVVCGLAVTFLLLPCLFEQFPPRNWAQAEGRWTWLKKKLSSADDSRPPSSQFAQWVRAAQWPIIAGGCALLIFCSVGLSQLQTTARLHDLFRGSAVRVLRDYAWLEERIGPLVPLEVVLQIPKDNPLDALERYELVQRVREEIASVDQVNLVQSAATFLPPPPAPEGRGIRYVALRSAFRKQLEEHRQDLIETGFLRDTEVADLWRISVRVYAGEEVNYERLIANVRQQVQEGVLGEVREEFPGIETVYSGSIPLVHKAQDQLLVDMLTSFLLAFVVIALAMVLLLRSISAGMVSMIPNLFPSVMVLGALGWLGVKIEVGTMMTASAALGIAVDDTLHFTTWFRRGLAAGKDRLGAVQHAYQRCGSAMLQTSLICGISFAVFYPSSFAPVSRFSISMASMLAMALVGDLILLPAILASPLGKVFQPRQAKS